MAKKTIDVVVKQVRILEPGDPGFADAAREHGLWLPTGWEEDGTFFEASERMAPDADGFEETLEEVIERGLYASVQVPED